MRLPPFLIALLVSLTACTSTEQPAETSDTPPLPNFIVIFADDLGYGDLEPFHPETPHKTPNVARMAQQGAKLTSFYSTSGVCTPSRSSLMTGAYPRRVNLHVNEADRQVLFPGNSRGLSSDEITVAEMLKEGKDYATMIVGKWHLGDQPAFLPTRHGFDAYFGIPFSNDMGQWRPKSTYPPLPLLRDEEVIETEPDQDLLTKRYTQEALRFIRANAENPFFLYLPHSMPHNPVHASPEFAGKSANGTYGDAIEEIDWSVGEILDTITELGIDQRTLVVFTSDNGASDRWGGSNGPLRGFKGSAWEGGVRVPCVMWWPGQIPAGTTVDALTATFDLKPTFAKFAGIELPPEPIVDGEDISLLVTGMPGAPSPHEVFYYYVLKDLIAVRSGPWKLHLAHKGTRWMAEEAGVYIDPALYNLTSDLGEQNNVYEAHPDVVEQLEQLADQARSTLGDGDKRGSEQRPAGSSTPADTLTHNDPAE